jgi:hypothetical protein
MKMGLSNLLAGVVGKVDILMTDYRELKKVASEKDVDSPEIQVGVRSYFNQLGVQGAQQFCIHHADFIDDQILMIEPQIHDFLLTFPALPSFLSPMALCKV